MINTPKEIWLKAVLRRFCREDGQKERTRLNPRSQILLSILVAISGLLVLATGALCASGEAVMSEASAGIVMSPAHGPENGVAGDDVQVGGIPNEGYGLSKRAGTGSDPPGVVGNPDSGGAEHAGQHSAPSSPWRGLLSKRIPVAVVVSSFVLLQVLFLLAFTGRSRGARNRPGGTGQLGEASVELRGDLDILSVPDLLQLVSSCRKTGTLKVYSSYEQKSLSFRDGNIISAACLDKDQKNKLGYLLVKRGKISEAARTQALQLCEKDRSKRLGQALIEIGVLTREDLTEVLKVQAEEIVYSMIAFPEGRFEFTGYDEAPPSYGENGFVLDVMSLVMEGVRRQDEWNRMRQIIPSLELVFDFIPDQDRAVDTDRMNPYQMEIVDQIDGNRTLGEICARSHLVDFEVCQLVYGLFCQGVLAKVEAV